MKEILTSTVSFFLCVMLTGCIYTYSFNHSPKKAARQAQQFASSAFIERDFIKAYNLFSSSGKKYVSFEEFRDAAQRIHPTSYPSNIVATDYEQLPGQKGMNIYLYGESDTEKFYYRFLMEGTAEEGYKVAGLERIKESPPKSGLTFPLD